MGEREFACQVPHVIVNSKYATSRNRRPCHTQACARLPKQESTQRECTASKTTPSDSKAHLCLSVAVAGPLGKPLSPVPSNQHPLSQPSSPSPIVACQHRFEPSLRGPTFLGPFATACVSRSAQPSSPLPIVACQHRFEPPLRGPISLRPSATACVSRCCCCCCG